MTTSIAVVVRCCDDCYERLTRLFCWESAVVGALVFPVTAHPVTMPVTQAVTAMTIRIKIMKLMTIIRINNTNNMNSAK